MAHARPFCGRSLGFCTRSCANRSSLTDAQRAVPARHEVAQVFNSWAEMPTFREEIDLPWTFPDDFTMAAPDRGVDPRPTPIRALAAAMTGEGVTRSPEGDPGRRSRLHGLAGYDKVVVCSSGQTAQNAHRGAAE